MTTPSDELLDALVQTSFTVMAQLNQAAAAHDLSLTQLRALAILRDREPRMAELAELLGLDRSSVSGLIDRSVKRGLVQRRSSDEDGRSIRVSLTADGHRLAAELTPRIRSMLEPVLSHLNPGEQKRLTTLLTRLLT